MIDELDAQKKLLDSLSNYVILIGVVSKDAKRKTTKTVAKVGITNAQLMFIHENGSPLRNIPARPVLEMTIKWALTQFDEVLNTCFEGILNGWEKAELELELNKLCIRMEEHARDIIYSNDGRLVPNSPAVARRKKGNHPLFDTGELARSITCYLSTENNM